MARGRPGKDILDKLNSLVQERFLRVSLGCNDLELSRWLQTFGLNTRDTSRFLAHQSTISKKKAEDLDCRVPGFLRVTLWPWSVLRIGPHNRRLLFAAQDRVDLALAAATDRSDRTSHVVDSRFQPIASTETWTAVEIFFVTVIYFRLAAMGKVTDWSDAGCFVLRCLECAYAHPLIQPYKAALTYLTSLILESPGELPYRCRVEWLELVIRHEIKFTGLLPMIESGAAQRISASRPGNIARVRS